MTDLSSIPWEDIQAEIERRYPLWAMAFIHSIDGMPNKLGHRFLWCKTCDQIQLLGEVELLRSIISTRLVTMTGEARPGGGLDSWPPNQPPNRTY